MALEDRVAHLTRCPNAQAHFPLQIAGVLMP